jgi:NitT/TauT family transport system substrate-binding protein
MSFLVRHAVASSILGTALTLSSGAIAQNMKTLLLSEPSHSAGTLPIYLAIAKGFFTDEGLDVKILTTDGGAAQSNAVLSGQAFAYIGGPEHNAYANLHGADLRAVVNLNDRSTVYFDAKKGQGPAPGQSMPDYMKGRSIAVGLYSGTPNSILRYLLAQWHLDPKTDVTINEMATAAALPAVKIGSATVGVSTEPYVTQGMRNNVWDEPFLNIAKEFGPYAYTTINVRLATIKNDPDTVRKMVKAIIRGLKYTQENPDEVTIIAKKEFPTMPPEDLKATLDRSRADEAWSLDGTLSHQSWDTASKVVLNAGVLSQPVPFDDIADMRFVTELEGAPAQ